MNATLLGEKSFIEFFFFSFKTDMSLDPKRILFASSDVIPVTTA